VAVWVASAGEDDGKIEIGVGVGVAHATAKEDHGVVEERALLVSLGFHLFKEAGEVKHLV